MPFDFIKTIIDRLWSADNRLWWVEINTMRPHCTYYFGPFHTLAAAKAAYSGYADDLKNEGSLVSKIVIKRCEPKTLTICHEEAA